MLLEENEDGVFEVVEASNERIKDVSDKQIVLSGTYSYQDSANQYHYVNYGIEKKHIEKYGTFEDSDQLLVTAVIGKWRQRKVIDVEKNE